MERPATPEPGRRGTAIWSNHSLKARAAAISIASNSALIVFKLVVGILSGSIAIISEALHSGSDLAAAIIAYYSVRKAAVPPDIHHHYGHEKVENLSGVVEALLIIAAAGVIIYEGILKIFGGPHLDHIWLGVAVMVVSGVVNLYRLAPRAVSGGAADAVRRAGGRRGAPADRRLHVLRRRLRASSSYKVTGWPYFDPIVAIAVAVLIIRTGYHLVVQSTRVLLDQTLPEDELEEIRRCVKDHRGDAHRRAITGCAPGRPATAATSTCTSPSTTRSPSPRPTRWPSTSPGDIRECVPNADVLVHIEPRSHEREDDS